MSLIDLHTPGRCRPNDEKTTAWGRSAWRREEPGKGFGGGLRDENRSEPVDCAPRTPYFPVAVWGSIVDPGPSSRAVVP
jgi:hypothetical protein